jgi:(E)-4-hydroxy-3-methylbut-2-enyl-diphosphate synthase
VRVAYQILQSLDLRTTGIDIVSCPTCSRCKVDLINIVNDLEQDCRNKKVSGKRI